MRALCQAALVAGTLASLFGITVQQAEAQRPIQPRLTCDALTGLDLSAELGVPVRVNLASVQTESRTARVCHISGTIRGTIGFQAWLPLDRWTGRYLQIGCGGLCGRVSRAAPQAFGCLP